MKSLTLLLAILFCPPALAGSKQEQTEPTPGQVTLPLELYQQLLESTRRPFQPPRPAPASYALGTARVTATVSSVEPLVSATIQAELSIDVLENEWVLVPVLPAGTPVDSAAVGGAEVQLLATENGLAWSTQKSGSYKMSLSYRVDAARSEAGFILAVPLPRASAIHLTATLPGTGLDVAVIPAAGTRVAVAGGNSRVTATVPTTSGVQISWRTPSKKGFSISRAVYNGQLVGEAVVWQGQLAVELFGHSTTTIPLLPRSVTLSEVKVDGKEASILVEGDRFATLVKGRGVHQLSIGFQVNVIRKDGPPRVEMDVPSIPVSRFDLTLPGKKELSVTPASNVTIRNRNRSTVATVHVPMTRRVVFTWSEAVPEEIRTEVRSNAAIYHLVHAEEGVLYVRAIAVYEVNRGETNVVELAVPAEVQINRITSSSGAVADWRVGGMRDGKRVISVFLDRQLRGELLFDVFYDRSLEGSSEAEGLEVPLVQAAGAQRQKGMIALLSNTDLTLNPTNEAELDVGTATKVGENQLPAFVRDAVEMTVAHTYKYTDSLPQLTVLASPPERAQGRFDVQIDTLISLGDVILTGAASVAVNLKSGRIMSLQLELPEGVNLLHLTAPSLRAHKVNPDDDRLIDLEFTQEMEGQFRCELIYERILGDNPSHVEVPTVQVRGAEVAQGRIAVEALSAIEVQPASVEQLSTLDVHSLPRQLILRTTNPILLAFKYIASDPPPRLTLSVTRHRLVGVQEAAIDRADYRTLFTRDGLFVTTARFVVRNARKQFLRLELPEGSEIWSAFVNGAPEKPALAEASEGDEGAGRTFLIKIIHSTQGFPVSLVYATRGGTVGRLGSIEATLPRPDILVTQSRWDVYLPDRLRYGSPSTNMELALAGNRVSSAEMDGELARLEQSVGGQKALEPLRITVPTSGVHYTFEKLYANQFDRQAWFSLPYASTGGAVAGQTANLLGVFLLWLGIGLTLRRDRPIHPRLAIGLSVAGGLILAISVGVYHMSAAAPIGLSLLLALALAGLYGKRVLEQGRVSQSSNGAQPG